MSKKYTLKEILQLNTVEELKKIAKITGVSGYSRLRKDKLIDMVASGMLSESYLHGCFIVANDREIKDFERAIKTQVVLERDLLSYGYWLSLGLVAITYDEEVHVPVEVEEKYKQIKAQKDYQEGRRRFRIIDNYALACTNLYAIIDKEKFLEILNAQTKLGMDDEEATWWFILRGFYRGFREYFYMDRYIMAERFSLSDEDHEDYHHMLSMQSNKPYYIPPKDELLKYVDDFYIERNPSFNKMLAFMKNSMGMDHKRAFDICSDMQLNIRSGFLPSEVLNEMQYAGVIFEDELQMRVFTEYFMEMFNNTRVPENRGYTPNEIYAIMQRKENPSAEKYGKIIPFPGAANAVRRKINAAPEQEWEISFGKIGRNDPCPCGSGKKYKNCCGRNKS